MQCAVHTLQFAICDVLKERHVSKLISIVRSIAICAGNLKIDVIFKRRAKIGAIIDQSTRWGRTYLMIESILQLKSILSDMAKPDLTISDADWEQVENLKEILSNPLFGNKILQCSNLTPGSFLKEWKMLIFCLIQNKVPLAEEIRNFMIRRKSILLDKDILLAVIYVDTMYKVSLTEIQQNKAKATLFNVAIRMTKK